MGLILVLVVLAPFVAFHDVDYRSLVFYFLSHISSLPVSISSRSIIRATSRRRQESIHAVSRCQTARKLTSEAHIRASFPPSTLDLLPRFGRSPISPNPVSSHTALVSNPTTRHRPLRCRLQRRISSRSSCPYRSLNRPLPRPTSHRRL
jgi:hypothetical protein